MAFEGPNKIVPSRECSAPAPEPQALHVYQVLELCGPCGAHVNYACLWESYLQVLNCLRKHNNMYLTDVQYNHWDAAKPKCTKVNVVTDLGILALVIDSI